MGKSLEMTMEEIVKKVWEQDNKIYKEMNVGEEIAVVLDNAVITITRENESNEDGTVDMNFAILQSIRINAKLVDMTDEELEDSILFKP